MSGKSKFYKKGQQGKGKSQAKGGNSSGATSASKKPYVTDFSYYLGSAKQASDYETTTEFVINYIKKLYDYGNDIGSALETLEPVDTSDWRPTMKFSSDEDETIRKNEDRQYEIGRTKIVNTKKNSRPTTIHTASEFRHLKITRSRHMRCCGSAVRRR